MKRVFVNAILPISTVDGPGARSTVFLQGCNVACAYCHNPETQRHCCHCGDCVTTCPSKALRLKDGKVVFNKALCIQCDQCLRTCTHRSTPKAQAMTVAEVFAEIMKNRTFIRGITVSGGECTLYPDFLKELFAQCEQVGLTTLLDSNGTVAFDKYPELLKVTTGVMLDVKAWDQTVWHNLLSQTDDIAWQKSIILQAEQFWRNLRSNLILLANQNKLAELRIVVMPDHVDASRIIAELAHHTEPSLRNIALKLIAFRPHNVPFPANTLPATSNQIMNNLFEQAKRQGFTNICIR